MPLAALIAELGPCLPFPMVHGRLRCQACGSRDIHARPDWPKVGQVARHGPSVSARFSMRHNAKGTPEWTI